MRSPFRSFTRFTTSTVLSLLAIVTILLVYNFLSTEYDKYKTLEEEQRTLLKLKGNLEGTRDQFAKKLVDQIPSVGTPADVLAERIKSLESEISRKQASSEALSNGNPLDLINPTSDTFRDIAVLKIEITFMQQGLGYLRNLHTLTLGPAEARRQIEVLTKRSNDLGNQIYKNQYEQWQLSKSDPLEWQIPFTKAYEKMKELESAERQLQGAKRDTDAKLIHQKDALEVMTKRIPGPFILDKTSANRIIQPVYARMEANDKQLDGSNIGKFMRPVKEVLPTALKILVLALLSPLLVKTIAYYVIAPIAARRAPVRLLPGSSGKISTSIGTTGNESGPTTPSRVSLPLSLDERSELLVLPSYLQGMPLNAQSDTKWLLDWSMPLTSLLAGMYRLTRIRPNSNERITVSSSLDPLAEFSLLDVPVGSALVLQPHCLVGVIQTRGEPLKITRHWRFGNLGAWLTLQFRYIVFHGPAQLIVKGCRGVRVEPAISGRTVNQAATLGFSANLDYSVARNETFWSYYFGERELFNDSWRGDGCCVHAETPNPGDHSGLFGRGLQGLLDTFLKIFGI
jgi:hypothetical protein